MKMISLNLQAVIDPDTHAALEKERSAVHAAARKGDDARELGKVYETAKEELLVSAEKGIAADARALVKRLQRGGVRIDVATVTFAPRQGTHGGVRTVDLLESEKEEGRGEKVEAAAAPVVTPESVGQKTVGGDGEASQQQSSTGTEPVQADGGAPVVTVVQ